MLRLGSGESLSLTDGNDAPGGASYVSELDLADGLGQIARIEGNGLNLYYDPNSATDAYLYGRTYALDDGGLLAPITDAFGAMEKSAVLSAHGFHFTDADAAALTRFEAAPVPEPSAAGVLASLGLGGLLARRRRRPR